MNTIGESGLAPGVHGATEQAWYAGLPLVEGASAYQQEKWVRQQLPRLWASISNHVTNGCRIWDDAILKEGEIPVERRPWGCAEGCEL